jgi:hypothetical protein
LGEPSESVSNYKSCEECDQNFTKNFELEHHMVEIHRHEKQHACNICGKQFYLKWRLKRHMEIHQEGVKFCHFFINKKQCPYAEIVCKFLHQKAGKWKMTLCTNRLCQFEHETESETENVIYESYDENQIGENYCHLCDDKFSNLEHLCEHFQTDHEDYHQKMVLAAQKHRKEVNTNMDQS